MNVYGSNNISKKVGLLDSSVLMYLLVHVT